MGNLRQWLTSLGLGQYAETFESNDIDWTLLPELDQETLKDIGVSSAGHRLRILKAARSLDDSPEDHHPPQEAAAFSSQTTAEAERRQLTVMFCDLVGSVELGERMDVEDYRDLLARFRGAVVGAVVRYEGFVARHQGDGLLVYFGYPLAHEDEAERAVRAGLDIVQAVESLEHPYEATTAVRVGVATGPTVVGDLLETGGSNELAALGQTPNLAVRLQGEAGSNELIISETTHRLAARRFETKETGSLSLKGFQDPIVAYRVEGESGARSRWEETSLEHFSPLVGRGGELALLEDRWTQAKDGSGQVVLISAEPGVGKSRLVQEFRRRLGEESHTPLALYCTPYHTSSALHPVNDVLRRRLGLGADRGPLECLDALEHWVGELGLAPEYHLPILGPLLAVEIEPRYPALDLSGDERRRRTLDALAAVIESLCASQPVLVIGEDLHWLDPTTQQWLGQLVEIGRTQRLLMLLTFRPEYEAPWRGEPHLTEIRLNHLTHGECRSFVGHLSGNGGFSEAIISRIVERTDGVPLYLEELSRAALAADDPEAIPETLRDALTGRLDCLGPAKPVAQAAAALGREFPGDLVPAVSGLPAESVNAALNTLVESGLVHSIRSTAAGDYQFKHALVRDAAYESLLRAPRQSIHKRAAEALAASEGQVPTEIIAYHFEQAGIFDRAELQWEQAGLEALDRGADEEAGVHFRHTLELAQAHHGSPERCLGLTNRLARTLHLTGKRVEANELMLCQASLASLVTDYRLVGHYHRTCGLIRSFLGERDSARESFEKPSPPARRRTICGWWRGPSLVSDGRTISLSDFVKLRVGLKTP